MKLTTNFSPEEIPYTGRELRPHFILERFKIKGSALVSFEGECRVSTEELVDWEDRLENSTISARRMLHFIGEFFGYSLRETIWLQIFLVTQLKSILQDFFSKQGQSFQVIRQGDDLYIENRKLTVSIVTASPVSTLLHLAINIDPSGAPVPAIGLHELGIPSREVAERLLECFEKEIENVEWACVKVRPVV